MHPKRKTVQVDNMPSSLWDAFKKSCRMRYHRGAIIDVLPSLLLQFVREPGQQLFPVSREIRDGWPVSNGLPGEPAAGVPIIQPDRPTTAAATGPVGQPQLPR